MRKGRFDEIFFIDLPDTQERADIFGIHIKKRGRDPANFDLDKFSTLSDGFSGAEIEQIVVASLFAAFDAGRDLSQQDIEDEIANVVPLSVMMKEDIAMLRDWAKLRARPASRNDDVEKPKSKRKRSTPSVS